MRLLLAFVNLNQEIDNLDLWHGDDLLSFLTDRYVALTGRHPKAGDALLDIRLLAHYGGGLGPAGVDAWILSRDWLGPRIAEPRCPTMICGSSIAILANRYMANAKSRPMAALLALWTVVPRPIIP